MQGPEKRNYFLIPVKTVLWERRQTMVNRGACQNQNQGMQRGGRGMNRMMSPESCGNRERMVDSEGCGNRMAPESCGNRERMMEPENRCMNRMMEPENRGMNRTMEPESRERSMRPDPSDDWRQEVPSGNRRQLLNYIDEVSFAAYDTVLYLDTHPECPHGLRHFRMQNEKRNFALREYARLYGPLTLSDVEINCDTPSWEWINQPWPWEGGNC
jgi:spore coat protein JB